MSGSVKCPAHPGPIRFDPLGLDYPRLPLVRYSSRGHPFTAWVPCGMPRINERFLECVFYLYASRERAEKGEGTGGTGFLVGVPSSLIPGKFHVYGVTNHHVAIRGGHSVVRVNCHDDTTDILEFEPCEWEPHPAGDDLAVVALPRHPNHKVMFFGDEFLLPKEQFDKAIIGPGEEAFMVGRFIKHDGIQTNAPSVRFGNLSMMPLPIWQPERNFYQESFAVEMRSLSGYSGSPVFIYRLPWDMETGKIHFRKGTPMALIGVDWGYIVDNVQVKKLKVPIRYGDMAHVDQAQSGHYREVDLVPVSTYMNGVVPSWKLLELLNLPKLQQRRLDEDSELIKRTPFERGSVVEPSSEEAVQGDEPVLTEFGEAAREAAAGDADWFEPTEAARRRDQTLRRMLATPPKPQKDMKRGVRNRIKPRSS